MNRHGLEGDAQNDLVSSVQSRRGELREIKNGSYRLFTLECSGIPRFGGISCNGLQCGFASVESRQLSEKQPKA